MDEMNNTLNVRNLCGGYEERQIFDKLSFSTAKGSFTALIGPNGSGKSTLLKFFIKELKASGNSVFILGKDVSALKQKELAQELSFVGQNSTIPYEFTVEEIVSMGNFAQQNSSSKVLQAMKLTGITYLKDKLVTRISGGEMQMTMLARAICQDTQCIILDEPVNNLDPKHQIILLSLLKELSKTGKTVLCVLHDLNAVLTWCDSCILLKNGRIEAMGNTTDVITKENVERVYEVKCSLNQVDGHTQLTYHCSL